MSIVALPRFQFLDANGDPAVGYLLYTYANGTTTEAPTYQDADLSTLNENPIELDARGECVAFIEADTAQTWVLKSGEGVDVWSQDDVSVAGFAGGTINGDLTVNGFVRAEGGSEAEPGIRVGAADTGLSGDESYISLVAGGVDVGTFDSGGVALPGNLDVAGDVTAGGIAAAGAIIETGAFDTVTVEGTLTAADADLANVAVTGTFVLDGSEGTVGQVLTSAGTGQTPTWQSPSTPSESEVMDQIAEANVDAVGAYVFASIPDSHGAYAFGDSVDAAALNLTPSSTLGDPIVPSDLTGTWKCCGAIPSGDGGATLWKRIA